jgi:hypothetical protein
MNAREASDAATNLQSSLGSANSCSVRPSRRRLDRRLAVRRASQRAVRFPARQDEHRSSAVYDVPVGESLYPGIAPYDEGMLDVGAGDLVYWESCGDPTGKAALALHGGPGSGCTSWQPRLFDPGGPPDRPVRPAQLRAEHAARERARHRPWQQHHTQPRRGHRAAPNAPRRRALAGDRRIVRERARARLRRAASGPG